MNSSNKPYTQNTIGKGFLIMTKHIEDVQPLRNKKDIERMKQTLRDRHSERDYIMFLIGVNTGLRVGDILNLKTEQILNLDNRRDKYLLIIEQKTKNNKSRKPRKVEFKNIWNDVINYAKTVNSEWLFPSRQGDKAISTTQAYRVLKKAAERNRIDSVGTHTMRKTFGYHMYKATRDVAMVQRILNHAKPEVTLRYIGITDDEVSEALQDFVL